MTAVKICGIRDRGVLELLGALSVEYAGLVFAPSRRRIDADAAAELVRGVSRRPRLVGVFVDPDLRELEAVLRRVPLDGIQLHGREQPDFCRAVRDTWGIAVWKAVPVSADGVPALDLDGYRSSVDAVLLDTYHPTAAGGTGRRFAWEAIPRLKELAGELPVVVAGGVHEANVGELVCFHRPWCVDVSSGVETNGVKDPEKIRRFVERVRACDANGTSTPSRTG